MSTTASNLARTVSTKSTIQFAPNSKQVRLINLLLKTGLFGGTASQVIQRMIDQGLILAAKQMDISLEDDLQTPLELNSNSNAN